MATTLLANPLRPSLYSADAVGYVCKTCRRNAATYRRTRKALRVKMDDAFAPSQTETQDHIIFNPPSSAPNVYHTPPKFLPPSDPRRALHTAATAAIATPATPAAPTSALAAIAAARLSSQAEATMTPVRPQYEKKYHLNQGQIDEIRALRAEDPRQWTRERLAEKFECSQFFVSLCCKSPVMAQEQEQKLAEVQQKWGRRKKEAREDRQTRKNLWGRDA